MLRWLLVRLAWLVVTLLGITFVTFVVVDLAPGDRAEMTVVSSGSERAFLDQEAREAAILQLRVRHGMVDPETFAPYPVWQRYGRWLGNAVMLRFAGPGEDHAALWQRLAKALPVTAWLGGLALLIVFGCGIPLGAWLGLRAGSRVDRTVSTVLLVGMGIPEFLLASLLLLAFSVAWLQVLPVAGLRTPGSEQWNFAWQLVDFAKHLVLPVGVLAFAPMVMVSRFVRDSVARAATSPFVASMHALGVPPEVVRARLLRHGCAPVATLVGSLLPMLVGGSIVVESLFALDGVGHLAVRAALAQEQPMLMAILVVGSLVTLAALVVSDLLHRVVDARVRLPR
ncbi:MAG: ABC transporter permease [Planctomycetes bacterium]|nr:ABC transporter permease [Planctomycetota bacterium]